MTPRPRSRSHAGRVAARRRAGPAGERGFTLAEVVVSLGVFMVGALALAMAMPLATRLMESAGVQTSASEMAAQRAERLLATPWDDDDLAAGSHLDSANPHERYYYVRWNVEADEPTLDCKRVTVNVCRFSPAAVPLTQLVVVIPQTKANPE
jgi:Tfp pilus assembly protein PilV